MIEARQRYEPDTAVLVTELRSPTGLLAVTDALALRPAADLSDDAPAGRRELIRSAVVLDGSVRFRVEIEPRGGASAEPGAGGLTIDARRPDLELHVRSNRRLESLRSVHELDAGERLDVALSWGGAYRHHRYTEEQLLDTTERETDWSTDDFDRYGRLVIESGRRYARAQAEWARWAVAQINALKGARTKRAPSGR